MLCPITKFYCSIQPYSTRGSITKRHFPTIYPIAAVTPYTNFNCIYSGYRGYNQSYCPAPMKISKSELDLTNALVCFGSSMLHGLG